MCTWAQVRILHIVAFFVILFLLFVPKRIKRVPGNICYRKNTKENLYENITANLIPTPKSESRLVSWSCHLSMWKTMGLVIIWSWKFLRLVFIPWLSLSWMVLDKLVSFPYLSFPIWKMVIPLSNLIICPRIRKWLVFN